MFLKTKYQKILIVESSGFLTSCTKYFDPENDLILTFDLAVKNHFSSLNCEVHYIDRLLVKTESDINNFIFYSYFQNWFKDSSGKDIFRFKNIDFGFSFRLEIWNDLSFYVRCISNLQVLCYLDFDNLYLFSKNKYLSDVLYDLQLPHLHILEETSFSTKSFYFNIFKWLEEKVSHKGFSGFKYVVRDFVSSFQGFLLFYFDKTFNRNRYYSIFIQVYHPTIPIVDYFSSQKDFNITLATYYPSFKPFRYIPDFNFVSKYKNESNKILYQFLENSKTKFILGSGLDITDRVKMIIYSRLSLVLPSYLSSLDNILDYFLFYRFKLIILVANIGKISSLVSCVCNKLNIPSFLIINGFMSGDYSDESKYASFINSYSDSIKKNYFGNKNNVSALGDPRMDFYANFKPKVIDYKNPCILIGASGFSSMDLNSFVAVEFEFLYDVLSTLKKFTLNYNFKIVIKVRPNGYKSQYVSFIETYFPSTFNISIYDNVSMISLFQNADLYLSIASQTLFEASCLGIPTVYYKNDLETIDPPFSGLSELVRAENKDELYTAIEDFFSESPRFLPFLSKQVMEKYIGPLDGNNLSRNISFIRNLLNR